jgi:hypothetical protein
MASLPGATPVPRPLWVTTMTFGCRLLVASWGACLALQPSQGIARDQEQTREALNALGRQMSTCAAFFSLATTVLKNAAPDGAPSVTSRYEAAGKVMLAQAMAIADVIGLEPDVPLEWSRADMRTMVKEINADPKSSAALMTTKYDEPCQELLKDSGTRFRELIDKDTRD